MTALSPLPADTGRTLLSYGLKPSFLAGALWAGIASLIVLPMGFGGTDIATAYPAADWHAHEALFGYLAAIVAGFVLTAMPGWTGRAPVRSRVLTVLIAAWLAGRVAIAISGTIGPIVAGAVDGVFLLLAAGVAAREAVAGGGWKTLAPAGFLAALFAGNVLFLLGAAAAGQRIGIAAVILLVTLIGRTGNAGEARGESTLTETAVLPVSAVALAAWIVFPGTYVAAGLVLAAGAVHAVRLVRWLRDGTLQNTFTLIQYIAYGLVVLGFLGLGVSGLTSADVPVNLDVRAWTMGATGILTLALVNLISLDETGRPASARPLAIVIYAAVVIAVIVRFLAGWAGILLPIGAAAWVVAFAVFVLGYAPVLATARLADR